MDNIYLYRFIGNDRGMGFLLFEGISGSEGKQERGEGNKKWIVFQSKKG